MQVIGATVGLRGLTGFSKRLLHNAEVLPISSHIGPQAAGGPELLFGSGEALHLLESAAILPAKYIYLRRQLHGLGQERERFIQRAAVPGKHGQSAPRVGLPRIGLEDFLKKLPRLLEAMGTMSLLSVVEQLRGPACVALAAEVRSRRASFLFPQRNASGLSFPKGDRRSAAGIKASAIGAAADMKKHGRDAQ